MTAWKMMLPAMMFAIASACSSDPPKKTGSDRLCVPNDYIFCKCADNRDGTKQCSADGQSFSECDCGAPLEDTGFYEEDTYFEPEDTITPSGAEEKCPGQTIAVDPGKLVEVKGDTTGSTDDGKGTGACAVALGKDHVYAIVPTGTGRLNVKMTGVGTMDPSLHMRSGDCATGPQMMCGETTGAGGTEQFNVNVVTGQTYYLWADGKAGSEGQYALQMTLTTGTFCGDGTVDNGEACDDGNKTPGDGCENDCRPSGNAPASDACPGITAHIWPSKPLSFAGSTTDANLSYQSDGDAGCGPFGNNATDRVYALVAHKTGTMTVEVDAMYNTSIYVRTAPCATGAQIACAASVGASTIPQTEKVTFSVADGQTYYLVVDGALNYRGTYTVKASLM